MKWSGFGARFKDSLSDAFAPLLSPTSAANGGVCSVSSSAHYGRSSPPLLTSPKSDPTASSVQGSYFPAYGSRAYWKKQLEADDDDSFTPAQPKRLEVRLPSLTRKRIRSRSRSSDVPSRGILVRQDSGDTSTTNATAGGKSSSRERRASPVSPGAAAATVEPQIKTEPIPLRPCCATCEVACELAQRDDYVEYWSPAAKRKRAEEAKRSAPTAGVTPAPFAGTGTALGGQDGDDDDEEVPLHTGAMASHTAPIVVDELPLRTQNDSGQGVEGDWAHDMHRSIPELDEDSTVNRPRVASPTPSELERADRLPVQQQQQQQRTLTTPGASLGRRKSNAETVSSSSSTAKAHQSSRERALSAERASQNKGWAAKFSMGVV